LRITKGFEAQSATQGIGLVAMRKRAELLGGTVQFLTQGEGGKGTVVRLTLVCPRSLQKSQC
jgi:signal transduction histidine kinase